MKFDDVLTEEYRQLDESFLGIGLLALSVFGKVGLGIGAVGLGIALGTILGATAAVASRLSALVAGTTVDAVSSISKKAYQKYKELPDDKKLRELQIYISDITKKKLKDDKEYKKKRMKLITTGDARSATDMIKKLDADHKSMIMFLDKELKTANKMIQSIKVTSKL